MQESKKAKKEKKSHLSYLGNKAGKQTVRIAVAEVAKIGSSELYAEKMGPSTHTRQYK